MITRQHLSRRTVLRGLGTAMALPFLDAMVPAMTAQAPGSGQLRLGCIYVPHGAIMDWWTPAQDGPFEITRILKPIEKFQDQLVVVSGLAERNIGTAHLTASAMWLNGVSPKRTEAEDVGSGITLDQYVAQKIGQDTLFPSLELGIEDMSGSIGSCDGGYSCIYLNSLSWRTPTTPLPMELNPRALFERMFGDTGAPAQRIARMQYRRSILDSISEAATALSGGLGAQDRVTLSEYLDNIRQVEQRIQRAEQQAAVNVDVPAAPSGIPDDYDQHVMLMYELAALAFRTDTTRVFTFMKAHEGSQIPYPQIGIADGHHSVSHHRDEPERILTASKIHEYHYTLFGKFLDMLRSTPDGDGNLLDHSMILYGSGMANANIHQRDNLPLVVVGGAGGRIKGNRHLRHPRFTPHTNLLLALAEKAGVELQSIGDSNGKVAL